MCRHGPSLTASSAASTTVPTPSGAPTFPANPMVTLNHAVAVAMVRGPRAGLDLLRALDDDDRLARHHRLDAVRAHLLEIADEEPSSARSPAGRRAGGMAH